MPKGSEKQKMKILRTENRSYQLTSAGRSAHGWQIGWHCLAGNSHFPHGRIFISFFLNPWASILKFWKVFCLGKDFSSKSILTGCARWLPSIWKSLKKSFHLPMAPPTIPPLASNFDPLRPTEISMFLCPVLPIDNLPSDLKFFDIQSTLPMTLPIFIWTLSSLKFTPNITKVSQECAVVRPIQVVFFLLS